MRKTIFNWVSIATLTFVTAITQAASPVDIPKALAGHWTGTLEYRDYGNDRRVTLPTQLEVVAHGAGEMDLSYVYDDGPGKIVRESSHVIVDLKNHRYITGSDTERDPYWVVMLSGFDGANRGHLLLEGHGTENDHAVKIRTSIVSNGDQLSILRESQLPGEPFKFRHQYRFSRTGR